MYFLALPLIVYGQSEAQRPSVAETIEYMDELFNDYGGHAADIFLESSTITVDSTNNGKITYVFREDSITESGIGKANRTTTVEFWPHDVKNTSVGSGSRGGIALVIACDNEGQSTNEKVECINLISDYELLAPKDGITSERLGETRDLFRIPFGSRETARRFLRALHYLAEIIPPRQIDAVDAFFRNGNQDR